LAVAGVGFFSFYFRLLVCFSPHDGSKTDAAMITKLALEMASYGINALMHHASYVYLGII